jgi:putative nucleotidyltransferase with HDIG domain
VARRPPPQLVTRALLASFLTVALVLGAVFLVISVDVRDRVRQSVAENLSTAQQIFTRVEARRQQEQRATVSTLAENPTLKAALDTWLSERRGASQPTLDELLSTVQREADKLVDRVSADVLAITDIDGLVVASAGPLASVWPRGSKMGLPADGSATEQVVTAGGRVFRVASVGLQFQDAAIGALQLGTVLDVSYARELATLSRGQAAIIKGGVVLASTLDPRVAAALQAQPSAATGGARPVELAGESWAVQPLFQIGDAHMLGLASIDAAAARETTAALTSLAWIALGAVSLAILASVWLARTLTRPIDQLSHALTVMAADRVSEPLEPSGTSRELDQLTRTFNSLMTARAEAEAAAEATYLGAVRALAAALDARDPYTAGHSERVSALSVAIGHELSLDAEKIETLRLGALLHDVGKIGVPDEILRKPDQLTPTEFDAIKTHPSAGARILRSIPFLAPHIPIVELHHERIDGGGYPYGLRGDAIPEAARIVHVADAFDAMTSARAYRPGRLPIEAITELRECVGTDFDGPAVEALVAALPRLAGAHPPPDPSEIPWTHRARASA